METYEVDERVFAKDQLGMFYESKVLDVANEYYYVHYQGWNERWDEWIGPERMLKYNAGNRIKVRKLNKAEEKRSGNKTSAGDEVVVKAPKRRRRRKKKQEEEEEDGAQASHSHDKKHRGAQDPLGGLARVNISATLPYALRRVLLVDYQLVHRSMMLVRVPRRPSVHDLMDQYCEHFLAERHRTLLERGVSFDAQERKNDQVVRELVVDLKAYFDRVLPLFLLYKLERLQLHSVLASYPNTPVCQLYGAEHLLRFIIKLPALCSKAKLPSAVSLLLNSHVANMVQFLALKAPRIFGSDNYENMSVDYQRFLREFDD